ncbi:unnamed protein product [Aphis gossypii]|uniref:Uncharacterized protein n=1 Tax=Aphis gossypii TaxID=80765 RepID=A0A9P0JAR1_APHGO|nr:unnamed protein product [Aphis gossypii]
MRDCGYYYDICLSLNLRQYHDRERTHAPHPCPCVDELYTVRVRARVSAAAVGERAAGADGRGGRRTLRDKPITKTTVKSVEKFRRRRSTARRAGGEGRGRGWRRTGDRAVRFKSDIVERVRSFIGSNTLVDTGNVSERRAIAVEPYTGRVTRAQIFRETLFFSFFLSFFI